MLASPVYLWKVARQSVRELTWICRQLRHSLRKVFFQSKLLGMLAIFHKFKMLPSPTTKFNLGSKLLTWVTSVKTSNQILQSLGTSRNSGKQINSFRILIRTTLLLTSSTKTSPLSQTSFKVSHLRPNRFRKASRMLGLVILYRALPRLRWFPPTLTRIHCSLLETKAGLLRKSLR